MIQWLRKQRINKRLKATMRPDSDFRERRLAQLSPDRRKRYLAMIAELEASLCDQM